MCSEHNICLRNVVKSKYKVAENGASQVKCKYFITDSSTVIE